MKCMLIISSLPDIIFIHADKGFIKHINKVSREAGFIGEHHNDDEMDMTALSQIFSPMITSLTYMSDLGNPYSSILCEDGTLFVFRQVCILRQICNVLFKKISIPPFYGRFSVGTPPPPLSTFEFSLLLSFNKFGDRPHPPSEVPLTFHVGSMCIS